MFNKLRNKIVTLAQSGMRTREFARKIIRVFPLTIKLFFARGMRQLLIELETTHIPHEKVNELITTGNYDEAEQLLLKTASRNPVDIRIGPYITRIRFLKERASNTTAKEQTNEMMTTITAMNNELKINPIYLPGEAWDIASNTHIQLLEKYGVENFKRTVSHGYQNWFMCSLYDPQVKQLLKTIHTNFTCDPWINTIETPDHVGNHENAYGTQPTKYFENPVYRLAYPEEREIYRIAVGLLWEEVRKNDPFRLLDSLTESEIGNPIRIWRNGKLISSDLAHSLKERNMLLTANQLIGRENLVVGELGAGHGRLAEIFGRTTNYRYFIFDITPAIYVAQWYIKRLFPEEKIFEFRHFDKYEEVKDEISKCRFAFFTSNQIEKLPDNYFDIFINMNSLAEMRQDQVKNFISQINRLTTLSFLSRQELTTKSSNPWLVPNTKEDFSMPIDEWETIVDKPDDFHNFFFVQIWRKKEKRLVEK